MVVPEIKIDRKIVYPTQPFEVALRVLVRPLPQEPDRDPLDPLRRQPPHIDVNWVDLPSGLTGEETIRWLQEFLAKNESGFTLNNVAGRGGFFLDRPRLAVFNFMKGREKRKGRDRREVDYFVYELKRRLIPEKAGTYTLGPAFVKGSFVDGMEGGRFTGRRLVAVAPAVAVEVKKVPPTRPVTYCGGIGAYRVAASANPKALRVGDPLTLSIRFERGEGSGSLDLISAPNLEANSRIAGDFEIIDKNPTGHTEGDVKRFEYALRPRRAGVEIPPVTVIDLQPRHRRILGDRDRANRARRLGRRPRRCKRPGRLTPWLG